MNISIYYKNECVNRRYYIYIYNVAINKKFLLIIVKYVLT